MSNNNDNFRNLREKRERDQKAFNEKQQTIKTLNERFIQNQSQYEKIVAQVLEELKEAIDPTAIIVGPKELMFDLKHFYDHACDMLSHDSSSKQWNLYLGKAEHLRGMGDQRYLKWEFKSKNNWLLWIYAGLINYHTIGFVCDNGRKLRYGELSHESLVQELNLFYDLENAHDQQGESVDNQLVEVK